MSFPQSDNMDGIIYNNDPGSHNKMNDINDEHDGIKYFPTDEHDGIKYYPTSEEFNEINDQNQKLQIETNKLKEVNNNNLLREKQSIEQHYESIIKSLELKLQKQSNETNGQKTYEQTEEIIASLQNQLKDKDNEIHELKQKNTKLKDEASKYQAALGNATNVRLDNDDQNHSVQLREDIEEIQRKLENYVTTLKTKIDINIKEVNILIKKYGCQKEITPEKMEKPIIKAFLQRKVFEQIFEFAKNYKESSKGEVFSLESDIDVRAHELLDLVKNFTETRVGTDEVSKVAAIKIRQQIYEILGNRGFSDIISSQQNVFTHNFINDSSQNLNEIMNLYRQINDTERKNEVEKLAPILIRDVLRLFCFRLMVQEPIPEIKFFESNAKINPDLMTGKWEDDELEEICVDLCYFPLIGRDLDSNYKVITPAKVLSRLIQNQFNTNEEVIEQNPNEEVSELNVKEKVGELNVKEEVGELNSKEEVEKVGELNVKEEVSELNVKEEVGELNIKEKVGELNIKEKVGELNSKEKVGELNSKEKVGELNIKEKMGELNSKEEVGGLNAKEVSEQNEKEKVGELNANEVSEQNKSKKRSNKWIPNFGKIFNVKRKKKSNGS